MVEWLNLVTTKFNHFKSKYQSILLSNVKYIFFKNLISQCDDLTTLTKYWINFFLIYIHGLVEVITLSLPNKNIVSSIIFKLFSLHIYMLKFSTN